VQGSGERLPFGDGEFDAVVCTLVLCSVADPVACVREMARVLRPGGRLLFVEHVRAPEPGWTRTAQSLLDPLQVVLADGCHLSRDTLGVLRGTRAFAVPADSGGGGGAAAYGGTTLRTFDVPGLGPLAPHAAGVLMRNTDHV
jgi:SAM-dependent methyltransferase